MGWACRANPKSDCDPKYQKRGKEVKKMNAIIRTLKRFGRATLSLFIASAVATATKNPAWMIFAPILQALGKFLREKLDIPNIPV